MTLFKFAAVAALSTLSLWLNTANGATASASFQATFVVLESCTIASQRGGASVRCQFNSPYLIEPQRSSAGANVLSVVF